MQISVLGKSDIREIQVDKSAYSLLEDMNDMNFERTEYLRACKYFLDIFFLQS